MHGLIEMYLRCSPMATDQVCFAIVEDESASVHQHLQEHEVLFLHELL